MEINDLRDVFDRFKIVKLSLYMRNHMYSTEEELGNLGLQNELRKNTGRNVTGYISCILYKAYLFQLT